jgi:hypothetical protein
MRSGKSKKEQDNVQTASAQPPKNKSNAHLSGKPLLDSTVGRQIQSFYRKKSRDKRTNDAFAGSSRLAGKPISALLPEEGWVAELSAIKGCEALREGDAKQITLTEGRHHPMAVELCFRGLQRNGEDVLAIMARDLTRYIYPRYSQVRRGGAST